MLSHRRLHVHGYQGSNALDPWVCAWPAVDLWYVIDKDELALIPVTCHAVGRLQQRLK